MRRRPIWLSLIGIVILPSSIASIVARVNTYQLKIIPHLIRSRCHFFDHFRQKTG